MRAMRIKLFILLTSLGFLSININAQEELFKSTLKEVKTSSYCFYPSTLRMIDLSKNPEYQALVNDIRKLLVYKIENSDSTLKVLNDLCSDFMQMGYDELMQVSKKERNSLVLVNEKNGNNGFTGFIQSGESLFAFYLQGTLALEKIPQMIEFYNSKEFINIFDNKQIGF